MLHNPFSTILAPLETSHWDSSRQSSGILNSNNIDEDEILSSMVEDILPNELSHGFQVRYLFDNGSEILNMLQEIQNQNHGTMSDIKVTLTNEEYDSIQTERFEECKENMNSTICIICNDEFQKDDIVKITKCSHVIHDECLKPWLLNESKKCPVCRAELGTGRAHLEDETE
jgi:hypothetical protein